MHRFCLIIIVSGVKLSSFLLAVYYHTICSTTKVYGKLVIYDFYFHSRRVIALGRTSYLKRVTNGLMLAAAWVHYLLLVILITSLLHSSTWSIMLYQMLVCYVGYHVDNLPTRITVEHDFESICVHAAA